MKFKKTTLLLLGIFFSSHISPAVGISTFYECPTPDKVNWTLSKQYQDPYWEGKANGGWIGGSTTVIPQPQLTPLKRVAVQSTGQSQWMLNCYFKDKKSSSADKDVLISLTVNGYTSCKVTGTVKNTFSCEK